MVGPQLVHLARASVRVRDRVRVRVRVRVRKDGDEGAHGVPGGAGGADGCRRVQTGADKSVQEGCRKGVEVQMACMDLLILL